MCTMVAPARAAAMPDSAICSGVTGTCSERPTVSPAPVSAQVIMTLRFTVRTPSRAGASTDPRAVREELPGVVLTRGLHHRHHRARLDDPAGLEDLDPRGDRADQREVVG